MRRRGVKTSVTQNPDGTLGLQIDPVDLLAEAERTLAIEKSLPFFLRDKLMIMRQEDFIANWKKQHGL